MRHIVAQDGSWDTHRTTFAVDSLGLAFDLGNNPEAINALWASKPRKRRI
jgi:hypothetical protein